MSSKLQELDILMALVELYATACVKDHMATMQGKGTFAEEAAEQEMNDARTKLRAAIIEALARR